jgi:hypothetical protein
MALGAAQGGSMPRRSDHPRVHGVLVDIPAPGGWVTVVALGDNTTSLYTSTGGGTVGAGERPEVAASTHRLLTAVDACLESFGADDGGAFPPPGWVRLHVLTDEHLRRADVPEDAFWGRIADPLMHVIGAVQEVVSPAPGGYGRTPELRGSLTAGANPRR